MDSSDPDADFPNFVHSLQVGCGCIAVGGILRLGCVCMGREQPNQRDSGLTHQRLLHSPSHLPAHSASTQTAEGMREAGLPEWFQLVGLLHDMGKVSGLTP